MGVARTNRGLNGMPDRILDKVPDECPTGGRMGCPTGQTGYPRGPESRREARWGPSGCPTRPDKVPDGSHVIGHIIFECHVICLGWQG
jgi:hypothetical protein